MSKLVVTKNGRKSFSELKQSFEKVIVKHEYGAGGTVRTTALLVQDGIVHVGVSKYSNRGLTFSKSKGAQAALGRAELAANIMHGIEESRKSKAKRREELSFSVISTDEHSVDSIITSFIGSDETSQQS